MFIDQVRITVQAGRGGDGRVSLLSNRSQAKGGPDGGDGGDGGDVIIQASHNYSTLSHFRGKKRFSAENGQMGDKFRRHGKRGQDITLEVPVGTVIKSEGEVIADLVANHQAVVIAKGGEGGYGNAHFTSSRRQTPRFAELGLAGENLDLDFELKLLADVGLIGLPNAGKSSLISVLTSVKPKIANYPFTTIVPKIGIANYHQHSFVIADLPGLIAGASQGKGLGQQFLRHIERCRVLVELISIESENYLKDIETIISELQQYKSGILLKRKIVFVVSKIDLLAGDKKLLDQYLSQIKKAIDKLVKKYQLDIDSEIVAVSSLTKTNLDQLKSRLAIQLEAWDQVVETEQEVEMIPVIRAEDDPELYLVEKLEEGKYIIKGQKIERFAMKTNFDQDQAVARLRDILVKMGIDRELSRQGIKLGDQVEIANKSLEY
ncbi:GTPase ObgE [Candidatus Saccharibacteria bacterium]|nr:GTPase ObgE [Candidatus Saccharibacteria bacterium]